MGIDIPKCILIRLLYMGITEEPTSQLGIIEMGLRPGKGC
jgi:hypothetical protein